jgi:ribosome-binding factor A
MSTKRRYPRTARVNKVLREVLAETLEKQADHDERLSLLTITAVDADPDLRHATVYFDHLDGDRLEALDEARVRLQSVVAAEVRLKWTPLLAFRSDPAVATGKRVEELLRTINRPETQERQDAQG